jgi:hypothetical protein
MKTLTLATVLCLVLAGCGEDKSPGNPIEDAARGNNPAGMPMGMPTGMAPGMPGGLPTGLPGPDMLKKGGTIKLTDDMMKRYVELVTELKGVNAPDAAMLARYKFNMQEYLGVGMIIGSSTARSAMSGVRPQLEKQLAELRAKRDAGKQPDPMVDRQIKMIEEQMKALGEIGEPNEVDAHNVEVVERWQERIDAAMGR